MASFIEAFYFGDIAPQAQSRKLTDTYQKELALLEQNEKQLIERLTGEEKRLFLAYANAYCTTDGEASLDSFITGFQLGAMFVHDTFCGDSALLQNHLRESRYN